MTVFKHFVDVLEVAVRIERLGTAFYRKLHETVEAPEAKGLFSFLAAEEERHGCTFRTMLDAAADYPVRDEYPGEYGLFLKEYAAEILRAVERAEAETLIERTADAIDLGIALEKETILLYLEIQEEGTFKESHGEELKAIIKEERSHWRKLMALKQKEKAG